MLEPSGRVIMISGANRGIGLMTAQHLSELGYSLSLGARDPTAIPASDWLTHEWQATDAATGEAWARATLERFGRIDGVVMNAGVELGGALLDGPEEQFDAMWDVNFKGPLRLVRACLPSLRASGAGRVVNVVSLAGKRVLRHEILGYSASKHAALALTHAVRRAGWDNGVRATAVCPGMVETDMTAGHTPAAGQFKIAPQTIAASIAYALALPNEAVVAELLINSRFEPIF
jgi:NAD(P)-dependent dehydrogenase (short-subunit alcohol dehydrogenase family)